MKTVTLIFFCCCFVWGVKGQNYVGVGTNTPLRSLHLTSGTFLATSDTGTAPSLSAGAKFLWVPSKYALRAGYTSGSGYWDNDNIGPYSFTFGNQSNASGTYGFSGGNTAFANGINSVALGNAVTANANYATAIGQNLSANAYNSFVIGRYNETEGNNSTWVESDPLLVVGNGYTTLVNGFPFITRRDAFKIYKNGNSFFNGSATINNNLNVNNLLQVSGKTTFYDSTLFNDNLVLSSGKEILSHRSGGQYNEFGLVPLGIVKLEVSFTRDASGTETCTGSYTNLLGNLIISKSQTCQPGNPPPFFATALLNLILNFNQGITDDYDEIIASPSLTYDALLSGTSVRPLGLIMSQVLKNTSTGIPQSFTAAFSTESMRYEGEFKIFGTVIFYGLRN